MGKLRFLSGGICRKRRYDKMETRARQKGKKVIDSQGKGYKIVEVRPHTRGASDR